jgi:hypothetical protein
LLLFDLSAWNEQSLLGFNLSYFWNKKDLLRFNLFKFLNKQSWLHFDLSNVWISIVRFILLFLICFNLKFLNKQSSLCFDLLKFWKKQGSFLFREKWALVLGPQQGTDPAEVDHFRL